MSLSDMFELIFFFDQILQCLTADILHLTKSLFHQSISTPGPGYYTLPATGLFFDFEATPPSELTRVDFSNIVGPMLPLKTTPKDEESRFTQSVVNPDWYTLGDKAKGKA